jgi:hypothetical protein
LIPNLARATDWLASIQINRLQKSRTSLTHPSGARTAQAIKRQKLKALRTGKDKS